MRRPVFYIIARFYETRAERAFARYARAKAAAEKFFRKAGL